MIANIKPFFGFWGRRRDIKRRVYLLDRREIFVLPTSHGMLFALILLLMLAGSINYDLSLGLILTFLLGAMAVVSVLHTFRNLARLRISVGRSPPVFAGTEATFSLCVENISDLPRYGLTLVCTGSSPVRFDVPPRETARIELKLAAPRRGILRLGRCHLATCFPLGLFNAWANLAPDAHCLVYPNPQFEIRRPLPQASTGDSAAARGLGADDFSGLRSYQRGDSLRHVAWKSVARGHPLVTKQFDGHSDPSLWLSWNELPAGMDDEAKLSRLARWVLDAGAARRKFGLLLPGKTIAPDAGELQQARCLTELARFGQEEASTLRASLRARRQS